MIIVSFVLFRSYDVSFLPVIMVELSTSVLFKSVWLLSGEESLVDMFYKLLIMSTEVWFNYVVLRVWLVVLLVVDGMSLLLAEVVFELLIVLLFKVLFALLSVLLFTTI